MSTRWNHNLHYTPLVLQMLPDEPRGARVLDAGCGEGDLARALAARGATVLALDRDATTLGRARAADDGSGVEYVIGDVMSHPLPAASFDLVAMVAVLHHLDAAEAVSTVQFWIDRRRQAYMSHVNE